MQPSHSPFPPLSFPENLYDVRADLDPAIPNPDTVVYESQSYKTRDYYVLRIGQFVVEYNEAHGVDEQLTRADGQALDGETALVEAVWAERQLVRLNDLEAETDDPTWAKRYFGNHPARRAQLSRRDLTLLNLLEKVDLTKTDLVIEDDE